MGLYTGENNWVDDVYQFETTDLVVGGPNGVDNKPLKELADRTIWLRNALRGYAGITAITASKTLTIAEMRFKAILIQVNPGQATVIIPDLSTEEAGFRVSLSSLSAEMITLQLNVSTLAEVAKNRLYLGNGERLELIWSGSSYFVASSIGNLLSVGDIYYGYLQKVNTIIAQGQLENRADHPRLWEFIQTLGSSVISDSQWTNTPNYKGFFSAGNTTTTFRVPDLRSMFIRGLDLGAGISLGRNNEAAGGYEGDDFKSHAHTMNSVSVGQEYSADSGNKRNSKDASSPQTGSTGGTETRPKNIGLIPLIKV